MTPPSGSPGLTLTEEPYVDDLDQPRRRSRSLVLAFSRSFGRRSPGATFTSWAIRFRQIQRSLHCSSMARREMSSGTSNSAQQSGSGSLAKSRPPSAPATSSRSTPWTRSSTPHASNGRLRANDRQLERRVRPSASRRVCLRWRRQHDALCRPSTGRADRALPERKRHRIRSESWGKRGRPVPRRLDLALRASW